MLSTYLGYRFYAADFAKSLQRVAAEPTSAHDQAYYQANIGKVTSVDGFVKNYRLYSYALKAFGLEDKMNAPAFMKKVLESDLTNSKSFANSLNDTRFKAFAAAFSFTTKGTVADTRTVQAADQEDDTVGLYTAKAGVGSLTAASDTAYYEKNIGNVKSIDDLLNDARLYSYVTTAYGINGATASRASLTAVLESDASDSNSVAARAGNDGSGIDGLHLDVQSLNGRTATEDRYSEATGALGTDPETLYYNKAVQTVTSVDQFVGDSRLVAYVTKAYGLTADQASPDTMRKILTSDLGNPMSVANQLGPTVQVFAKSFAFQTPASANPFLALAADFNFASTGAVTSRRAAQSAAHQTAIEALYTAQAGTASSAKAAAGVETSYYKAAIGHIGSLDQLLSDNRLTGYVTKAYGLDPAKTSTTVLRKILTSDLANPKSTANALGSSARNLAAAFNFNKDGSIARPAAVEVQSAKDALIMGDTYLRQTMEDEAGTQNEGVQLALYFQRKAPSITSPYAILADKALLKVFQTAFGLSASGSQSDIDAQARQITKAFPLANFKDPKKVEGLITRFAAFYDQANASSQPATSALLLGTGDSGSGSTSGTLSLFA